MADPSEAVAQFVAFTGSDEGTAMSMLEATGFQLEAAVNLFYAGGPAGAAGADAEAMVAAPEDDEALARRLNQEINVPLPNADAGQDEVRAPLDVYKSERLVGDDLPRRSVPRRTQAPVPHNVVDAFRDFSATGGDRVGPSLADMFEPPREMLFSGSFEEAKQHAAEQSRWLIVNLQSTSQFASHQLNRDTWGNATLRELVQANFVLFQVYDAVQEGQKLAQAYRLLDTPVILVLDPVTGAVMRQWNDFVDAERLTEELLPFLEHDIHDPAAARFARRVRSKREQRAAAGGGAEGSSKALTEDEELQRALEMSMAEAEGRRRGAGASSSAGPSSVAPSSGLGSASGLDSGMGTEEEAEEGGAPPAGGAPAAPPARPAAEVQAEAEARLPPEPADGSVCRIAVRLPDGRRAQRRFPSDARVAAVYDFCLAQNEEAAGGRRFTLSQGFPGAPALTDQQQLVQAAGLSGAMLVLKWQD